jgi:predicted O-methyltransferase YrrM
MPNVVSSSSRWEVLDKAIRAITIKEGLKLEFGVFRGESINYIAKKLPLDIIYGFDSFEGLPQTWRDGFEQKTFSVKNLNKLKFEKNVKIVKGYFEDTLPTFISQHRVPIAFVHIDSDIYESAKSIFKYLKDQIITGTVIVFDEFFNYPSWEKGEFKAFMEFVNQTGKNYEYITYNRKHEQVSVKIL